MDVKALIVEQLEEDGTLRILRYEPTFKEPLIVAFGHEYNEPRSGPFHFQDERHEMAFDKAFADCPTKQLGNSRFNKHGEQYSFVSSWQGMPTQSDYLTYYALCLPEFAIPKLVELSNPITPKKHYRKTVYRDDHRNRFVISFECPSSREVLDFELRAEFNINREHFSHAHYLDAFTDRYGRQFNEFEHLIPRERVNQIQKFFAEKIIMGDEYTAQQAGAIGAQAQASDMTFLQNSHGSEGHSEESVTLMDESHTFDMTTYRKTGLAGLLRRSMVENWLKTWYYHFIVMVLLLLSCITVIFFWPSASLNERTHYQEELRSEFNLLSVYLDKQDMEKARDLWRSIQKQFREDDVRRQLGKEEYKKVKESLGLMTEGDHKK